MFWKHIEKLKNMKSNNLFKRNLVFLLSLGTLILSGVATYSSFLYKQSTETSAAVGNYTTNPNTYYTSVENKTQNQLLWGLHDLMISTHRTYTHYDDMGKYNYQSYTDKDPNNSNNILAWYSRASIPKAWSGGLYDREHVWPQSLSENLFGKTGAGSDMHHIRPTIVNINGTRGNKLFGNVGNSYSTVTYGTNNLISKYTSNIFEPHDQVKGDAARIIMYLYVHYNSSKALGNGSNVESYTTTLPITNVIQGATNKAAFDLLLNWHELDPVDNLEIARNNQVAIYQGNRNPFIDRPEFASYIWGEGTAPTALSISPNTYSIAINEEKTLSVTPTPTNANKSVNWSSSNSNVVGVTNGIIKGISAGTATITAASTLNSSVKATATVTVSHVGVTSVSLPSTITMNLNETQTIIPTFVPSNASNKNVTWNSSNTSVATIHSTSGLVTAKKVGNSTITVTTQDGNKVATSALEVTEVGGAEVTYTVSSTTSVTTSGTQPPGSTATYSQTYSATPGQHTKGNSATLTLQKYLGYKINKIILSMRSNKSNGAGKLDYSSNGGSSYINIIPESAFNTSNWNGAYIDTSYVDIEKSLNIIATSSDIIFKITATVNSLYCESFTIIYDAYVVLDSLQIVSSPTQMSYFEGEGFNYAGLKVLAHYSNNTSNDVTEDVDINPDPLTYGTTYVTISYTDGEVTKSVNLSGISVTKLVLSSIVINSCPYVTTYPLGSAQDFMGLTLLATYTNGHTAIINDGYTTSLNTMLLGEQVVNVNYGGKATSFDAYVTNENANVGVSVTPLQQAVAWSNYFLELTSPTCLEMSGNFSPYWSKLKTEFNYFASASKNQLFYNESNNSAIDEAIERYIFIVKKYSSLDDFITNSDNETLNANIKENLFYKNDNYLLQLVIFLSLLTPSVLYFYFKLKKKRLN